MSRLTFRFKLMATMLPLLAGLTIATLLVTHRHVAESYRRMFAERFELQTTAARQLQEARLASVKRRCADFASLVRLGALMRRLNEDAGDAAAVLDTSRKLYGTASDEIGDFMASQSALFLRLVDSRGRCVPTGEPSDLWSGALEKLGPGLLAGPPELAGYLDLGTSHSGLVEVVFARLSDRLTGETLGGLILGFPVADSQEALWVNGRLHAPHLPQPLRGAVSAGLENHVGAGEKRGVFSVEVGARSLQVHFNDLGMQGGLPPAFHVQAFDLAAMQDEQRRLALRISLFGLVGLLIAAGAAAYIAHGLTVPIRDLVGGTKAIREGRYDARVPVRAQDELGDLASSFNDMATGLALKEKYRSVLDKVTDRGVTEKLMQGELKLGGERREACALFCDIRGFSAMTQHMDPQEVVQMLNEHFTPLTEVVYRHHGVVDKYVGDLIMAVFGAPAGSGNDVENALACAVEMVRVRAELNEKSARPIRMGIGVAAGTMLAGCMGSRDRLNYTVLGERVNLASRLCSKAGPMDVLTDEYTLHRAGPRVRSELFGRVELKGFAEPVAVYRVIEVTKS